MVDNPTNPGQGTPAIDPNAQPAGAQAAAQGTPAPEGGADGQPAGDQKVVPLAALHESREREKALKAELEALKTYQPAQPQQYYSPQPMQPQIDDVTAKLDGMWEEDPRRAMQTEILMAFNWYDSVGADLDAQEAKAKEGHTDFDTYRPKVREYLRSLPVAERAKPGVVESAYYFVKGQNADTLLSEQEKAIISKIRAGEAVQGIAAGASTGAPAPQATQATPEQINAANAMGMKVEDYMAGIKVQKG